MANNTKSMKFITAEEQAAAVDASLGADVMQMGDKDSEDSWDEWIDQLKNSEGTGTVRAYKLPMDADGNATLGKGTRQTYLGSWPHQMYGFDGLLEKIKKDFLKPGELAHIKVTGTAVGSRGVVFSRVVSLQRPESNDDSGKETVSNLFRLMQEGQERQAQMMREIFTPLKQEKEIQSRNTMDVVKDIFAIVTPLAAPIIAALVSRPAKPPTDLGALISAMSEMKSFITGKDDESTSEDSTTVAIVKAVAPSLPQLLSLLGSAGNKNAMVPTQVNPRISSVQNDGSIPTTVKSKSEDGVKVASTPLQRTVSTNGAVQNATKDENTFVGNQIGDNMLHVIKPQLEQLAELAEQNTDTKELAVLVLQMLPAEHEDALAELVSDPKSFARLGLLSPKVALHKEWFEKLRQSLHAELFEPETAPVSHLRSVENPES